MEIDRVSDDDSSPNSILNLALNSDMEELHENVAVPRESLPMLTGPSYSGALVPATAGHDLVPMTRRHQQRQRKLQVSVEKFPDIIMKIIKKLKKIIIIIYRTMMHLVLMAKVKMGAMVKAPLKSKEL